MIFCEKILAKIKISLHRSVEKLRSHKRYFCLFVCLGAFISEIELPRIPTYLLKFFFTHFLYLLAGSAGICISGLLPICTICKIWLDIIQQFFYFISQSGQFCLYFLCRSVRAFRIFAPSFWIFSECFQNVLAKIKC